MKNKKQHDDEILEHRYQYYYYPDESEIQRVHDTVLAVKNGKKEE